jgi:malonyl-CoA O-methyltransferase
MTLSDSIREFYDRNNFPGAYTAQQIAQYNIDANRYIKIIDQFMTHNVSVLDVGCGTGFITNLMARRFNSKFTGVDFSTAAKYASQFATQNQIDNAEFIQCDFFEFDTGTRYDVIVAQSFLTHVPDQQLAINKLQQLLAPGGIILLGVYNCYGKFLKNWKRIDYKNERLRLDQESNPYEVESSHKKILNDWQQYQLLSVTPSFQNKFVDVLNLFNYRNGGLTLYVFKDTK